MRPACWAAVALLLTPACGSDATSPGGGGASLVTRLTLHCSVQHFELWSTVPPITLLCDAVLAGGFDGTIYLRPSSSGSGSYSLIATTVDPLGAGANASGALVLQPPDSLRFTGWSRLPGTTRFELAGSVLTLTNPQPQAFSFPAGPIQVTTRIVCQKQ